MTLRRASLAAALFLLVGFASVACATTDPETAGNRTGWFFGAVEQSKYSDAYDMLCSDIRQRVTVDDFTKTGGGAVSAMIPNSGINGGEGTEQMPDISTLSKDLTTTWVEVVARRYKGKAVPGQTIEPNVPVERWRIDLRREGDAWKLCGFRQV
jgi:hypothetical protein